MNRKIIILTTSTLILFVASLYFRPNWFGLVAYSSRSYLPVQCDSKGSCSIIWSVYKITTKKIWATNLPFIKKGNVIEVQSATVILPDSFRVQINKQKRSLGVRGKFILPTKMDSSVVIIADLFGKCLDKFIYYSKKNSGNNINEVGCK